MGLAQHRVSLTQKTRGSKLGYKKNYVDSKQSKSLKTVLNVTIISLKWRATTPIMSAILKQICAFLTNFTTITLKFIWFKLTKPKNDRIRNHHLSPLFCKYTHYFRPIEKSAYKKNRFIPIFFLLQQNKLWILNLRLESMNNFICSFFNNLIETK